MSNVSLRHLQEMAASGAEAPAFVQNRCFARIGWDWEVRAFCAEVEERVPGILAADRERRGLHHPLWSPASPRAIEATPAQVVFRFAQAVGMLPLTGTTDGAHMRQDLASRALALAPDEVRGHREHRGSQRAGGGR